MGRNVVTQLMILTGVAMLAMACQRHEVTTPRPGVEQADEATPASVKSPRQTPLAAPSVESSLPAPPASATESATSPTEEKGTE